MSDLQKFLKWSIASLLIIIPFVFFLITDSLIFPYITGKNLWFRFIIEFALILYAILVYINKDYLIKKSKIFYCYLSFILILFVANIFGASPYNSFYSGFERMEGFWTHLHLLAYFILLVSIFRDKNDWKKVFAFVFVMSMPIFIYGYLQLYGQSAFYSNFALMSEPVKNSIQSLNNFFPTGQGNGLRIDSTFGNSAYSAIFFALIIILSAMKAITANTWSSLKNMGSNLYIISGLFLSSFILVTRESMTFILENLKRSDIFGIYGFFVFLSFVMFVWLSYLFIRNSFKDKISSYFYALLSLSALVLLYYTQTRGTYIALLISILFVLGGLYFNRNKIENSFIRKVIVFKVYGLLLTTIFVIVATVLYMNVSSKSFGEIAKSNLFLNRITTINLNVFNPYQIYLGLKNDTYDKMVERFGEATLASRVMNIGMATDFVLDSFKSFLIGNGQENYVYVFSKYHDSRMYSQEPWFDRAHNVLFDWLTASGILGLFAYILLFVISIVSAIKSHKINIIEKYFISGALIAYFVHNLFVFDNITSYIMFIILIAYVASQENDDNNINWLDKVLDKIINIFKKYIFRFNVYVLKFNFLFKSLLQKFLLFTFIITVCFSSYKLVFVPMNTAALSINFMSAMDSYIKYPTVENFDKVKSYYQYILPNVVLGYSDILTMILQVLPSFMNIDNNKTEHVIAQKLELLNMTHNTLIKDINMKYKDEKTYTMIASFYNIAGQGDLAQEYFERAELAGGKKPFTKSEYALSLYKFGKVQEAFAKALEAYNLNPDNPKAREVLETIRAAMNSIQK